ncbi:MAG: methyltransferase domain-containing protein [Rhodospirillales bacterium]|nr:methyltransferase domain-containing protein [Rhodospirillales bacterium]
MWTDVIDLRDFYATILGRVARRMIARRIRLLWPDLHGLNVLGLGYANPYLGIFRSEAQRVMAMMPAAQGVMHWPADEPGLTALCDHTDLPLPDNCVDRALIVHALECAERTRPMMREVWRVLADGGRLLVVAPNRRGLWARFERSPFGHGRPYSAGQLSRTLRDAMFTPYQSSAALYVPPVASRMVLSSAGAWEQIGQRWFTTFAGVVMVEATKQIYAAPSTAAASSRNRAYIGIGAH